MVFRSEIKYYEENLKRRSVKNFTKHFICTIILWHVTCIGFSATYFYELYLHNEYYSEPPGFPSKFVLSPIIASFSGEGDQWHENRFSAGLIEALRLTHNHSWIEFIAAFGKEQVRFNHEGQMGKKSRLGWDDFLIDIGHNFLDETGKKQLLVHWLIGIPVARKVSLAEIEEPLWGTRTFATGPVIELVYGFIRNEAEDFFIGAIGRFLHRFKRSYEPILPENAFLYPGRQIDILTLLHYRYYGQNIEVGYVYSLYNHIHYQFSNQIQRLPAAHYNSFYADYFYFHEKLSMGFELNITKTFGNPYEGITVYGLIAWYF